jgi:hypothetical protein
LSRAAEEGAVGESSKWLISARGVGSEGEGMEVRCASRGNSLPYRAEGEEKEEGSSRSRAQAGRGAGGASPGGTESSRLEWCWVTARACAAMEATAATSKVGAVAAEGISGGSVGPAAAAEGSPASEVVKDAAEIFAYGDIDGVAAVQRG